MSGPVIDQVRNQRRRISAEHNHSVRSLGSYLTIVQREEYQDRLVFPKRDSRREQRVKPEQRRATS